MTLQHDVETLLRWLRTHGADDDDFPPATTAEQRHQLTALGPRTFPPELTEYFIVTDGLPEWFAVDGEWEFPGIDVLCGIYRTHLDSALAGASFHEQWSAEWFPIASNGGGDDLVLDTGTGTIDSYRHLDGHIEPVAPSLAALIARIVADLQQGRYAVQDGEAPEYRT